MMINSYYENVKGKYLLKTFNIPAAALVIVLRHIIGQLIYLNSFKHIKMDMCVPEMVFMCTKCVLT